MSSHVTDGPPVTLGLAALCAAWFQQVGMNDPDGPLARALAADYARMVRCLEKSGARVVAPGILSSETDAARAATRFRQEGVDVVVLAHLMWSEDPVLLALLDRCAGLPAWLWNYHPTGDLPAHLTADDLLRYSGTVGMLQGSAPFQRRNLRPLLFSGAPDDSALMRRLNDLVASLRIRKALCGLRAGQVAGRCEAMTGTFVDDAALQRGLGVTRVPVSAADYAALCETVALPRVDTCCADLVRRFPVRGVSDASLRLAVRNALALDDLVEQQQLGVVAVQDLDETLHRLIGTRACLPPPASTALGVAFGAEGDVHTTLAMWVASRAAGTPALYTEIFTSDVHEGLLLMGHAAIHDPRLAAPGSVAIVPDLEYRNRDPVEGAWLEFVMAPGPVTCVNLYDTGAGYRMTLFEGESIGPPLRIDGWAHAVVRPPVPPLELLDRLVHRGLTQHFAVVPGRVAARLRTWCEMAGVMCCIEDARC